MKVGEGLEVSFIGLKRAIAITIFHIYLIQSMGRYSTLAQRFGDLGINYTLSFWYLSGNVEVISYVKIGELVNINLKQLNSSYKYLFRNILKRLYQLRLSWLQVNEILSWMSGE